MLHSATAHQWRLGLRGKKKKAFEKAYTYLRKRMRYMRYAEYRGQGMPVGSGVTEAGCKTVYTQRLALTARDPEKRSSVVSPRSPSSGVHGRFALPRRPGSCSGPPAAGRVGGRAHEANGRGQIF